MSIGHGIALARFRNGALVLSAIALCAVSFWLQRENVGLRRELEAYHSTAPLLIPKDASVPPIRGERYGGGKIEVDFAGVGRRTLFVVLDGGCDFCAGDWGFWTQLSRIAAAKSETVVFGMPISAASEKIETNIRSIARENRGARVLYLSELSPEVIVGFDIHYVPETIVIDGDGRVLQAYAGVLTTTEFEGMARLL